MSDDHPYFTGEKVEISKDEGIYARVSIIYTKSFVVVFLWAANSRKPSKRGFSYTGAIISLYDS